MAEDRADETLQLEIEFHDYVVRAAGQAKARSQVVFDRMRKLAPNHREDVMLLLRERAGVVDQARGGEQTTGQEFSGAQYRRCGPPSSPKPLGDDASFPHVPVEIVCAARNFTLRKLSAINQLSTLASI